MATKVLSRKIGTLAFFLPDAGADTDIDDQEARKHGVVIQREHQLSRIVEEHLDGHAFDIRCSLQRPKISPL